MTADERAAAIIEQTYVRAVDRQWMGEAIAAAIRDAEREAEARGAERMRERCAAVLDEVADVMSDPNEARRRRALARVLRALPLEEQP